MEYVEYPTYVRPQKEKEEMLKTFLPNDEQFIFPDYPDQIFSVPMIPILNHNNDKEKIGENKQILGPIEDHNALPKIVETFSMTNAQFNSQVGLEKYMARVNKKSTLPKLQAIFCLQFIREEEKRGAIY
jgi:hypothetical protein